uniref:Putative secreted protein n=1 Tax=Anopheles darlingi TaxID=43151 RepID=A0A2M4D0J5_ANODA
MMLVWIARRVGSSTLYPCLFISVSLCFHFLASRCWCPPSSTRRTSAINSVRLVGRRPKVLGLPGTSRGLPGHSSRTCETNNVARVREWWWIV